MGGLIKLFMIKYLLIESGIADSIIDNFGRKEILTFHNNKYSLSQLLIRMKITKTVIHFQKKVRMIINPIQNKFEWIFLNYKCYISIELMFLKDLMLIKQEHQKSVIFVTTGISQIAVLSFNQMSRIDVMIY